MRVRPPYRPVVVVAATACGYLALGKLSLLLALSPGYASPIFPAAGLALAAALVAGRSAMVGVWFGSFAMSFWAAAVPPSLWVNVAASAGMASAAVAEACLAVWLIRRRSSEPFKLTVPKEILRFLLGGVLAAGVGATLGLSCLWAIGAFPRESLAFAWWNWWVGDSIGVFVFTPLLLTYFGEPRSLWAKRRVTTGLPLLAALLLYTFLFSLAGAWEQRNNFLIFERAATALAGQVEKNTEGYLDSLYALEGFLSAQGSEEQDRFASVSERWLASYQGIYDFSWIPRVTDAQRDAHERAARAKDFPGYRISQPGPDGRMYPAPRRPEYFPSRLIAPFRGDDNVIGFDQTWSPDRFRTMERARDSGLPAAVGPIRLIQRVSFRVAVIIYAPVYEGPHSNIEQRRKSLKGFVKAVFSFHDVLQKAARQGSDPFKLLLFDDEPARGRLLYPELSEGRGEVKPPKDAFITQLHLADKVFWLTIVAPPDFFRHLRGADAWMLLASGLVLNGLLSAFLLTSSGQAHLLEQELAQRNRISAQLKRSTEELSRSNDDLERFAYVASHDLQEPLRTITSYLRLLERRLADRLDSQSKEFLDFVTDGAQRMSNLIRDLLAYSQVGKRSEQRDLLPLGSIVEITLQNLATAIAESGAEVDVGPMADVAFDRTDGILLFQNLIGNALKYRDRERPAKIEVRAHRVDGKWLVSVRDNGIGIARGDCEKIFLVFHRLHGKREYPGTGIGLAICKRIVERYGGRIWAESELGQGTAFYFEIV